MFNKVFDRVISEQHEMKLDHDKLEKENEIFRQQVKQSIEEKRKRFEDERKRREKMFQVFK